MIVDGDTAQSFRSGDLIDGMYFVDVDMKRRAMLLRIDAPELKVVSTVWPNTPEATELLPTGRTADAIGSVEGTCRRRQTPDWRA